MTHTTPTGEQIKTLKAEARKATKNMKAARQLDAGEILAALERRKADALAEAEALKASGKARLEDLDVWRMEKVKKTKAGSKKYTYWMASWKKSGKVHHEHIGSCNKLSKDMALIVARRKKAEALGIVL